MRSFASCSRRSFWYVMASFMPAACNPCAMDHAIERLLATPKTTAFLPCRSADIGLLGKWKEYQRGDGFYHGVTDSRRHQSIKKWRHPERSRSPGGAKDLPLYKSRGRPSAAEKPGRACCSSPGL